MQVIHTIGSLDSAHGGPSRSVPALADHLGRLRNEWSFRVATQKELSCRKSVLTQQIMQMLIDRKELARLVANPDTVIVHDHGQWTRINHDCAVLAHRFTVPRVVSPRGMLLPWALNHKRWKKRLAWNLYGRRDLRRATVIHATSEGECRELRALGMSQPIAVIPNGVEFVDISDNDRGSPKRPYVLCVSRMHRVKGINELLGVWERLNQSAWELILAGPDEENVVTGRRLPAGVRYIGIVDGSRKIALMRDAMVFVLPSYTENFGIVVAEALMAGTPVITTHGTPWESLHNERCGWWIPMDENHLRDTLALSMTLPHDELTSMGLRGRAFVRREFSWPKIADQMVQVYDWLLSGGTVPTSVDTN